jgi:hypothetical protein
MLRLYTRAGKLYYYREVSRVILDTNYFHRYNTLYCKNGPHYMGYANPTSRFIGARPHQSYLKLW